MTGNVERQEWVLAHQAFPEAHRAASERFWHFAGDIAIRGEVELAQSEQEANPSTLLSLLQTARLGDPGARRVARTNVATDVAERLFKVADESEVSLNFTDDGHLNQEDIRLLDVHRNTLQHTVLIPEMLRRTQHEAKNVMLFEELHAQRVLENYDVLLFSPSSTMMSDKQKRDYGLFLDTDSCSIQLLSADGKNVALQTAFVAGKKTPEAERHDLEAIQELARSQNLPLKLLDGTDTIQYLMLVPKGHLQHGVNDVVRLYDEAAGGTFYGEAKPQQDYAAYAEFCRQRKGNFNSLVDDVLNQLLAEAHMLETPLEAIMRLDEISERLSVRHSVKHKDVNALVFGSVSAAYIDAAREEYERGNHSEAERLLVKAQNTADSSSCPLFKSGSENGGDGDTTANESEEKSKSKFMNCPFCKARVFGDPCAKVLSCWDCNAKVVNGQLKSKGDGGSKAREAKAAEARMQAEALAEARREAEMAHQIDEVFAETKVPQPA